MVDYPFPPSQLLDGVSEILEKFTFQESVSISAISLEELRALNYASQRLLEAASYFNQNTERCLTEKYLGDAEVVKMINTVIVPRVKEIPDSKTTVDPTIGPTVDLSESFQSFWNKHNA